MTSILSVYARFGADLSNHPVDASVLHHARRAVVDWYAAALPGAIENPGVLLERALADELDMGSARLVLGRRATARAAALINGTAAHTVEVDDIYREAIYHPGAPVIAAALAACSAPGGDPARFWPAVIAGYEISNRIGATLGREHYRFWHNTGTVGTLGAAAAAACALGLDEQRFTHALATATTFAAGLQQAFRMDSMSKPLHAGRAAEGGVLAAQAATVGVTGSLDVLDGEAGLGRAMAQGPDWSHAADGLGEDFTITRMTFKNHACCGHTFAAIDGALELQRRMGVGAGDIERIEIATYGPALEVAGNPNPQTAPEARFSIPFVVASALKFGSVRLAAFGEGRLRDAELRSLMARIKLSVDPELDAVFPGQRGAKVTILQTGGSTESYLQEHRVGDPELPLTDEQLSDKFRELAVPVLGQSVAAALLKSIWAADRSDQIQVHRASS